MIIAVRHGPVVAAGLCYGRWNVPLAEPAADNAALVASRLAEFPDLGPRATPPPAACRVVTSPAGRCRSMAADLAPRLGLPLSIDDRLAELSMGAWEGRSWAEIEAADGVRLASWMERWQTDAAPDGETLADLERRVRAVAQEQAATAIWVTHAGVIRALRVLHGAVTWPVAMRVAVAHLEPECFGTISREIQQGPRPAVTATAPLHGTGASNP